MLPKEILLKIVGMAHLAEVGTVSPIPFDCLYGIFVPEAEANALFQRFGKPASYCTCDWTRFYVLRPDRVGAFWDEGCPQCERFAMVTYTSALGCFVCWLCRKWNEANP